MTDHKTPEERLESAVCPIERRRLLNRVAQRKHRLRLKEQKANAAAENQKKCRDSNRYPKKSIESPPTPQEMFTQNDGNMTRCQRTDAISSAPRGDTMTPIEKMMWKQGSLTSCSAESLTAFEWTSPFESGYALLNGHA